jgi:hypothetical protein
MDNYKKFGCHGTITISRMATEISQLLKRGHATFFENLSTKALQKHMTTPFCGN